jgi:hypothetical protein
MRSFATSALRWDFWNNPLVVTAMRLKYRRGSPGVWAVMWILALLGVGALLHYLSQQQVFRFPTAYLVAILSLQMIVSAIIGVITTSSSMNAEVVNRTLDFQRIVTLSPRAILVGKMIGEPALSYFLLIASMPLAALCWGLGAASGAVIFWLYVNLITCALMWAALGLINSLTPPAQTAGRQKSGGGGAGFAVLFAVVPQLVIHGHNSLETPGVGDAVKLLSPLGSLYHLWHDDAWNAQVSFWGLSIPSLLIAPIAQLAVATWIVAAMSRRLQSPINPLASKLRSYATLAVVDVIMAAICFSQWLNGLDAAKLIYGYGLAHIIACLILSFATVPRKAAIVSWAWRNDGQWPLRQGLLTGDRSEMSLAVVIRGVIGVIVLLLALVFPMMLMATPARPVVQGNDLGAIIVLIFVLVVALGILHQLLVAATSKGGHMMFILFVIFANLLPPLCGAGLMAAEPSTPESTIDRFNSLSPVVLFAMNMTRIGSPPSSVAFVVVAYTAIAIISYAMLRRILRREAAIVRRKLRGMGLNTSGLPDAAGGG